MTNGMIEIEFQPYGKTPRLFRDMIVTEKIDGTNAGIGIERVTFGTSLHYSNLCEVVMDETSYDDTGLPTHEFIVWAQSRKRVITPGKSTDNAGFAAWVAGNAGNLVAALGPGLHFGEWYSEGIQGNPHGIAGKRLAMFNTGRYGPVSFADLDLPSMETVPVLYQGPFSVEKIEALTADLATNGSRVAKGTKAEGVIVYLAAARQVFKVLCEADNLPKTLRDAA